MIDVVFINYKSETPDDYWDMQMIKDIIHKELWSWEKQYDFKVHYNFNEVTDGAVVVMAARNQADRIGNLNADIAKLRWCVIILTGDEESVFPFEQITHPNWKLWVMSPKPDRHKVGRLIGSGYTPTTRPILKTLDGVKDKNWFFAGQINHKRRVLCADELDNIQTTIPGTIVRTPGFIQGLPPEEYYKELARAIIAPCPSGGYTPDTFRLFEALEAGCIPIADEFCEAYQYDQGYWGWLFGETPPFCLLRDYHGMAEYMTEWLVDHQTKANRIFAWWQRKKREMAYNLRQDIKEVAGIDFEEPITILIMTSPVESNPSTEIIEQCVRDVRAKLPKSEIILLFDGVNPKQEKFAKNYEEYTRRVLWLANFSWHNVLPILFDEHTHQVNMLRKGLELVKTETILVVEHDTPLCPDPEFTYEWEALVKSITEGSASLIRFHHEASILPESKGLLMGETEMVNGVRMTKTSEFSMRPHLASTVFYRKMLDQYFSPEAKIMVEDGIYKHVLNDCRDNGMQGWYQWRLWIYTPEGDNLKRSYHLDARGEEPKYSEDFVE